MSCNKTMNFEQAMAPLTIDMDITNTISYKFKQYERQYPGIYFIEINNNYRDKQIAVKYKDYTYTRNVKDLYSMRQEHRDEFELYLIDEMIIGLLKEMKVFTRKILTEKHKCN